jgi:methionyl-tRNA formyltransferase
MNVAFAGTPEFAAVALQAILAAGHQVPLVLTQPDRPAGRGMALQMSAVKQLALKHQLTVAQPEKLRTPEQQHVLWQHRPDVLVVAAYGLILPQVVLDWPRYGCLNIHGSLLPRWRGAAPIQRAIEAGDSETGITIMQMDAGLDTGAMLTKQAIPITASDNASTLHDKLAKLGADMIVAALAQRSNGPFQPEAQPETGVSYAAKISKAESALSWQQPAPILERKIRAFNPFPGCTTPLNQTLIKVWQACLGTAVTDKAAPGTVLNITEQGIEVACGEGSLLLQQLQKPGGKRLAAADFLRGTPLTPGMLFGA